MMSEYEKTYQPHEWLALASRPSGDVSLSPSDLDRFCTSSSQAFQRFLDRPTSEGVVLLDYEFLALDLDPTCGAHITQAEDGTIYLTVYTDNGVRYFQMV